MPDWRFLVVRLFGGANQRRQTCAQIKWQVEQRGLSRILPLVKFELGRRGEYFLGIAVDINSSVDGIEAEEVARFLLVETGIRIASNRNQSPLVKPEEVARLLRGNLECESFTRPILFEAGINIETPPVDCLFAELDVSDLRPTVPTNNETEKYSKLFYWCSTLGTGGLERIRQACQALSIDSEWGGAWSVLRRLVLLGHIEFDGGHSLRWSVIPPTLVTSIADDSVGFFVGQRTPDIFQYLTNHYRLKELPQLDAPPRVLVQNPNDGIYYKPDQQVFNAGCVSQQLSELLPILDVWVKSLPVWDEHDFGRFDIEEYNAQSNEFCPTILLSSRAGLFRFTLEQTVRQVVTIAFFDDDTNRWICGDYYGLRFIARKRRGLCQVSYHNETCQLVVPVSDRWPMPYERALVLASGALPQRFQTESGVSVLVYEGITKDFAARMCNLLELEIGR